MNQQHVIDHLFRHQHGRMVSILCRIFGLEHLETIEDAVQDTFVKAIGTWRSEMPENPEAWLTQAAKNRTIDLFRKLKSEKERAVFIENGSSSIAMNELFLEDEIADSQLRMIFTACHPTLDSKDQIAFALKTISGFSQKEIASALLLKEETIKKRLIRARKVIQKDSIQFEIPQGEELPKRLFRVHEVLYLLFNEGFHSTKKEVLVRKELCGEALRMCSMLIENAKTSNPDGHALFALMCFHSARLDSKIDSQNEIIDLKKQDRSKWHMPLFYRGNLAMSKAVETSQFSTYHYEAAIAAEHLKASNFEETDWKKILEWYGELQVIEPSPFNLLNMAVIHLQESDFQAAHEILSAIDHQRLEQRAYLFHGCYGQYYWKTGVLDKALEQYDQAIALVSNESEKNYLNKKRNQLLEERNQA